MYQKNCVFLEEDELFVVDQVEPGLLVDLPSFRRWNI